MSNPVVIDYIQGLPSSPFDGTGIVGILITNGLPTYFKIVGSNLNRIIRTNWYPANPASVQFTIRNLILVDNTLGTFGVTVTDNYLSLTNRGGYISFTLDDETNLVVPAQTFGPLSLTPLWTAPQQGLITGE